MRVVLLGHPPLVGQVRRAQQRHQGLAEREPVRRAGQPLGAVLGQRVEGRRAGHRALVDRAVGGGLRRDPHDRGAAPGHRQQAVLGHLADHRRLDVPLGADLHEGVDEVRPDHRHHPLLRLAHQDLGRGEARVAERDRVQVDAHAAVAAGRQLGRRAGDARRAQVLNALDQPLGEELEAALDQELLQERVADLNRRTLGGLAVGVAERRAGQHRRPADAVRPGPRAEQHDLVARPVGRGLLQVAVPHEAHAERVHQRVAGVAGVEDELAADVGQAEAVAVERDARDDSGQHPGGVVRVRRAEPERVHDRDRARAHRDDVPDDAADAGRRALVRLDEGRVIVALDLEGDRVILADVDHARVRADPASRCRAWSASGARLRRCTLDDLYEQCSLHMTE